MIQDHICSIASRNDVQVCIGCNGPAERDAESELAGMGNVDELNKDHVRYSWALGIANPHDPIQLQEIQKKHPGAKFDSLGRMEINNFKERKQRMREAGFHDWNAYY